MFRLPFSFPSPSYSASHCAPPPPTLHATSSRLPPPSHRAARPASGSIDFPRRPRSSYATTTCWPAYLIAATCPLLASANDSYPGPGLFVMSLYVASSCVARPKAMLCIAAFALAARRLVADRQTARATSDPLCHPHAQRLPLRRVPHPLYMDFPRSVGPPTDVSVLVTGCISEAKRRLCPCAETSTDMHTLTL